MIRMKILVVLILVSTLAQAQDQNARAMYGNHSANEFRGRIYFNEKSSIPLEFLSAFNNRICSNPAGSVSVVLNTNEGTKFSSPIKVEVRSGVLEAKHTGDAACIWDSKTLEGCADNTLAIQYDSRAHVCGTEDGQNSNCFFDGGKPTSVVSSLFVAKSLIGLSDSNERDYDKAKLTIEDMYKIIQDSGCGRIELDLKPIEASEFKP